MASHSDAAADLTPRTILSIRLPQKLARAIERVAEREANPLSATVRRLLTLGLEADEQRSEQ